MKSTKRAFVMLLAALISVSGFFWYAMTSAKVMPIPDGEVSHIRIVRLYEPKGAVECGRADPLFDEVIALLKEQRPICRVHTWGLHQLFPYEIVLLRDSQDEVYRCRVGDALVMTERGIAEGSRTLHRLCLKQFFGHQAPGEQSTGPADGAGVGRVETTR